MRTSLLTIFLYCSCLASLAQTDLSVELDNYAPGEVFSEDAIELAFTISNIGPVGFVTGDSIRVSATINGQYFGLDLLGTSTAIVLAQDLPVGGSFSFDPGPLSGSQTILFFPGATTLELCVIVWGKGLAAVDLAPAFPLDLDPTNNTACATFDPSATGLDDMPGLPVVNVFPNPAQGLVVFGTNAFGYDLVLNDASGHVVFTTKVTGQERLRINVDGFAPGLYLYSLSAAGSVVQHGKLIVQ
jgi:hypothetical protein